MKHSKLLLAAALSAAAWCTASQAETIVYDTPYYTAPAAAAVVTESGRVVYPAEAGYAVRSHRDYNGNWRQTYEPVAVVGTQRTYVYPESTVIYEGRQVMYPSYGVTFVPPFDTTITPRY